MSTIKDVAQNSSTSCNQGLFASRPHLLQRRSALRLLHDDVNPSPEASHDATQLAYEIMQHKTTIQRIANAFAV